MVASPLNHRLLEILCCNMNSGNLKNPFFLFMFAVIQILNTVAFLAAKYYLPCLFVCKDKERHGGKASHNEDFRTRGSEWSDSCSGHF
jgi:hypothetical protein